MQRVAIGNFVNRLLWCIEIELLRRSGYYYGRVAVAIGSATSSALLLLLSPSSLLVSLIVF